MSRIQNTTHALIFGVISLALSGWGNPYQTDLSQIFSIRPADYRPGLGLLLQSWQGDGCGRGSGDPRHLVGGKSVACPTIYRTIPGNWAIRGNSGTVLDCTPWVRQEN